MKYNIEDRCVAIAKYIIENEATVRSTAKIFGISKSTVHKDVSQRLKKYNNSLYIDVKKYWIKINKKDILEEEWLQKKNIYTY